MNIAPSYTVHNSENNVTALVIATQHGYTIKLRDDDCGEYVPVSIVRVPSLELAKKHAHHIADVPAQ
jgi:hypothetical protein